MEEDVEFENTCKTVSSKNSDIFISAFPGKLVFGEVNHNGYKKLKYFRFLHFEIFNLYLALLNIIKYIGSSSNILEDKGIIITKEEVTYYWLGKLMENNNFSQKVIVFAIEQKFETVFEKLFTIEQINDLIK